MEKPQDQLVGDLLALLTEDEREAFEERAAIFEFEAGMTRGHAECLALLAVAGRRLLSQKAAEK